MVDGEQLREVAEYKYLGRLATSGNDISKEVGQRITLGWSRFGEYSHFVKDRNILICWKRNIMDILPATTYGAETWTNKSLEETDRGPTKHGAIVVKHH